MKIVAILHEGRAVKAGVGKKGPWEMFEVELDSGDTATLFGPVSAGMEVETYDHEKYGLQYRIKRVSLEQIHEQLQGLIKMTNEMALQLHVLIAPPTATQASGYDQAKSTADRIKRPRPSQPVNPLDTIPSDPEDYDTSQLNGMFP